MSVIRLDPPSTLGTLLDALRPAVVMTVEPPYSATSSPLLQSGAMRTVVVDGPQVDDAETLAAAIESAVAQAADALILPRVRTALLADGEFALPVIALRAGTETPWIRDQIEMLADTASDHRRTLSDGHNRLGIVEIADRAAGELGGHIIVEDDAFQLLAHSRMIDDVDPARREAVLQRQLPGPYQQIFNTQGVLARLISGEDIIHTERVPSAGLGQRLIAAIRHHGRLLGTIWLARDSPVFNDDDAAALRRAASEMSMLLAVLIRGRDDDRGRRDEAIRSLLAGQELANPLTSLGHGAPDVSRPGHVIAIAEVPLPETRHRVEANGIRVLAEVTARSVRAAVLTTTVDDVAFMLHFGCDESVDGCVAGSSRTLGERLSDSFSGMGATVAIAVGRHWSSASAILDSQADARKMASAMRAQRRIGLATLSELWATLTVSDLLPKDAGRSPLPPAVRRLLGDSTRSAEQRRVVRIMLDHWGDVAATAGALGVHPNTVRYRLQRLRQTLEVDLRDPDTRLVLWMLLRSSG